MLSCFDKLSVEYCYTCMHGPDGCMVPSRHGEGSELYAHGEELEAKLRTLAKKESVEIEKALEKDKKSFGGHIKILILGGPSSGKSTIFKQMQIIHVDGFKKPQELMIYRNVIDNNIRDGYLQLKEGARILNVSLVPIEHHLFDIDDVYNSMSNEFVVRTTPDLVEPLTSFWESEQVQSVFRRRYDFELMDSTKYYFENIERIADPEYIPSEEDIVHSRKATVTVNSIMFAYTGVSLHMIDVGGQRSERKKWLHFFDDVRVVLFVVDLTGFAKRSEESRQEVSRYPNNFNELRRTDAYDMKVALKIFNDVAQASPLAHAVFLLFFNKVDLFQELLPHVQLNQCFTKYEGANTYDETSKFICEKFVKAAHRKKSIFPHFTTATNTENVKMVFRACMESVFKANSKATGLS